MEFLAPEYYTNQSTTEQEQSPIEKHPSLDSKLGNSNAADHFMVEDLFDFSSDEMVEPVGPDPAAVADHFSSGGNSSTDTNSTTAFDGSCINSSSISDPATSSTTTTLPTSSSTYPHFCNNLSVPYDDLAELEWLSNFVEESFSSEDLQKLQLISGVTNRSDCSPMTRNFQADRTSNSDVVMIPTSASIGNIDANNGTTFHPDMSVPAKARSKRSRAAPCNWASRLLLVSSSGSSFDPGVVLGSHNVPVAGKKTVKPTVVRRKRDDNDGLDGNGEGRKCMHCATDKTPQWRTGPMGPKTLCNACGVRYKSGRLVPEYRPAASPTFMLTKHSNSHRKVLELRRQKELLRAQQQLQHQQQQLLQHHQNMVFNTPNGDDYLIHQHVGPDCRQLI